MLEYQCECLGLKETAIDVRCLILTIKICSMKTIHKIQNVIAVIALGMSMRLAMQLEMTTNETISATIMVVLTILMLLERSAKEIHQKE